MIDKDLFQRSAAMVQGSFTDLRNRIASKDPRFHAVTGVLTATEARPMSIYIAFSPADPQKDEVVYAGLQIWNQQGVLSRVCEIMIDNSDVVDEITPEQYDLTIKNSIKLSNWLQEAVSSGVEWCMSQEARILALLSEFDSCGSRRKDADGQ